MLARRIIPCLDVKDGRTVKGINFVDLRDAGDAVELAAAYSAAGADELVFLDISASSEGRSTLLDLVGRVARVLHIPFTVGGGIRSIDDAARLLDAGADKISVNTAAVQRPELVSELAQAFGSQFVVAAVDSRPTPQGHRVHIYGGKTATELNTTAWCHQLQRLGAGEILLTSMNADGTQKGFDLELLRQVNQGLNIPLIASGGAGSMQHFADCFLLGQADAALAASVFHFGQIAIPELKLFLQGQGIAVRPVGESAS